MREASIDFVEIYGDDYQVGILNLIKYFAKHLGCRIASENWELPAGLVPSLAAESLAPFEISLSRNSEVGGYPVRGLGTLHNFPALAHHTPSTGEVRAPYLSGMIVGYLDVVYRYDWPSRYSWEGDPLSPFRSRGQARRIYSRQPSPNGRPDTRSGGQPQVQFRRTEIFYPSANAGSYAAHYVP